MDLVGWVVEFGDGFDGFSDVIGLVRVGFA